MKNRVILVSGMTAMAALLLGSAALAQKPKEKPNAGQGRSASTTNAAVAKSDDRSVGDKVRDVLPPSEAVFTASERTLIKSWFGDRRTGLPPGLAKRDRLPPGLEKQLMQRGHLPPGLEKKIQPLPWELERQLRVLPTGYRRVVIAGNVILMEPKTGLIYDILREVIP